MPIRAGPPNSDVRLLTHDTVPMLRAQSLSLAVALVPDEWLLPPEDTDDEKALKELQSENARLKKAEPQIRISCIDDSDNKVTKLEFNVVKYDALTDEQVET